MKILLVEDDKRISTAMGMRIKSYGYSFSSSPDAISAIAEAESFKPDLLILDVNLPGGDGFTVAERIKAKANLENIPIIFITASKISGLKDKAKLIGAGAFLEKPFDSMQLLTAIQDTMGNSQPWINNYAW